MEDAMAVKEDSYRKLAEHLDRLPDGFAPSETGAELRLLHYLFTQEEAELAVHLTLDREEASVIAERADLSLDKVEPLLRQMADKGLIFPTQSDQGDTRYQALPFVVGIYEFQVNNLTEDLLRLLGEYWSTIRPRPRPQTIPQMRTIPISESLEARLEVLPYEQVSEIVKAHTRYAVTTCICRRMAKMGGGGCDAPEESCLVFGEFADYYIQSGRGRAIDQDEVVAILARAEAASLVLQPSNSQDSLFVCCCCGCCCAVLRRLQRHPRPAEAVSSSFIARLEPEACHGCWVCLDRCQMQALAEAGDRVALNADRCIGCGLCVSTCPSGALHLVRKHVSERTPPPATLGDTWRIIARAQTE
jgi:Na+-translocating ferredoxin:NAD+ oxidoreductase subunit B